MAVPYITLPSSFRISHTKTAGTYQGIPIDTREKFLNKTDYETYTKEFLYSGLITHLEEDSTGFPKGHYYIDSNNVLVGLNAFTLNGKLASVDLYNLSGDITDISTHINDLNTRLGAISTGIFRKEAVKSITTTIPTSPADGDRYIVGVGAVDAWLLQDNKIAVYSTSTSSWSFEIPENHWTVLVEDNNSIYSYDNSDPLNATWVLINSNETPLATATLQGSINTDFFKTISLILNDGTPTIWGSDTYLTATDGFITKWKNQPSITSVKFTDSIDTLLGTITADNLNDYITFKEGRNISFSTSGKIVTILGPNITFGADNNIPIFSNGAIIDSGISINSTSATIKNQITSTLAVGGIIKNTIYPSGTEIETIVTELLAPYISPAFSSLSISATPSGTVEVGTTITINSASWSYSLDSDNNPPTEMYITGYGFNKTVTGTSSTADASITVQKTSDTSESWTLSGKNKNGVAIANVSFNILWQFKWFFGASSSIPTDASSATTLINSLQLGVLKSGKANNVTCTSANNTVGNYTYIAYAAKYGTLSNVIQNGALPVLGAFTSLGTFAYTNSQGLTENYYIYKSNADKAFASGVTLTIS